MIYPNGHVKRGGADHVSIYLALAEKSMLASGWQIQVNFKMFVFDFNKDQYYTVEGMYILISISTSILIRRSILITKLLIFLVDDDRAWRFQDFKSEWGFDKLLSVADLDTSKGYLSEDDTCIFGVEVFEIKYTGKGESLSIIANPDDNLYSWTIPSFSGLDNRARTSSEFVIGGQKWYDLHTLLATYIHLCT